MDRSDISTPAQQARHCPSVASTPDRDCNDGGEGAGLSYPQIVRLLEEQGQIGFWSHDIATDRITASAGLSRISGVPVTATRTRESMLNSIHPQDLPYQADFIRVVESGGHSLRREFRIVRPDGTVRWVSTRIEVVLGSDGRPVRYIGILADISERREAQQAVEFNQGRRAALVEATSALTWIVDLSGRPIDSSGWCTLTGMLPEHCGGEGWLDAVHPNDRDRVRMAHRSHLTETGVYNIDYRVLTREGRYRWVNARMAPVRDAAGALREWQGILLPIDVDHRASPDQAGDESDVPPLTGAQIRGARGLLDWSLAQLASMSGVSVSTIKRMEDGSEGSTRASKSEAVRRALQSGGVTFRTMDGMTWISR